MSWVAYIVRKKIRPPKAKPHREPRGEHYVQRRNASRLNENEYRRGGSAAIVGVVRSIVREAI